MSKTLLPLNEPQKLHDRANAYGALIKDYRSFVNMNPMNCEASLLPHLSQAVQVLYWSKLLTEDEQRLLIANSKILHKHLGTPFAIKKVFELLERKAKLIEWFEDDELEPYHFRVNLYDPNLKGYSKEHIETFELMLEVYKNVRSVLNEIAMYVEQNQALFCSAFLATGEVVEIEAEYIKIDFDEALRLKIAFSAEILEKIKL